MLTPMPHVASMPLVVQSAAASPSEGTPRTAVVPSTEPLSPKQLRKRLSLNWSGLVSEVYNLVQRQATAEAARQARLDAKATSLLSTVGLSLTVSFAVGGLLLSQSVKFPGVGHTRATIVLVGFVVAVAFGLIAGGFAIRALLVNDRHKSLGEESIFNEDALRLADEQETDEQSVSVYRRFMTVQLWRVARTAGDIQTNKSQHIKKGQLCFGGFLLTLLSILLLLCIFALTAAQ